MTRYRMLVVTTVALVAAALVPVATAQDVRGTCTQSSTSKLKLSEENGRIEVEFEVDQNRNGVRWNVTIKRNGTAVASTSAVTRGPSGSFEVRRVVSRAGASPHFLAGETPPGEQCGAQESF